MPFVVLGAASAIQLSVVSAAGPVLGGRRTSVPKSETDALSEASNAPLNEVTRSLGGSMPEYK